MHPSQEEWEKSDVSPARCIAVFNRPDQVGRNETSWIAGCSDYCTPRIQNDKDSQREHVRMIMNVYGPPVLLVQWGDGTPTERARYSYLPFTSAVYQPIKIRKATSLPGFEVLFSRQSCLNGQWHLLPVTTQGISEYLNIKDNETRSLLRRASSVKPGMAVRIGNGGSGSCVHDALSHVLLPSGQPLSDFVPSTPLTLSNAGRLLRRHGVGTILICRSPRRCRDIILKERRPVLIAGDTNNGSSNHVVIRMARSNLIYDKQQGDRPFKSLAECGMDASRVTAVGVVCLF